MLDYDNVQEVDRTIAIEEIGFEVERVPLVTEPSPHEHVDRLLVKRIEPEVGQKENLGIVKATRNHIPYTTLMEWVERELDEAGIEYKLKESLVTKKGDMYQEYLFNHDITTPDGEAMSPMIILKGSYVDTPMEMYFGTYRFVCSNGVMVGETIDKMTVKANTQDLLQSTIRDELQVKIKNFQRVETLYSNLQTEDFTPYLWTVFGDEYLGTKIKKEIINLLIHEGSITVAKEKIRSADLADPESLITIVDNLNAWGFYNMVTQVATIHSKSAQSKMNNFSRVSKDFGI